jgi:LPS-assembly protein
MRRLIRALWVMLALAAPVAAQDRASLIADSLNITGADTLVARGHVEIFFQGQRLSASSIVYDRANDRLLIEGPIVLNDGKGSFILASQADLSADLTEGVLVSARMVMNQQLQLAAADIMRVGGRYTALNRVAASSCKVCAGDPTPLWEIRARRVVHDQQERQLYFDAAQFRLAGLPVMYIPRLRMPDPTLKRATGFLMPVLRTTSNLGTGLRLPYFIRLGDHRDLTLTPYFTTSGARTVDLRYRQAFASGDLTISGGVSRDNLLPGETRGYLLGKGRFNLPLGFQLDLRGEVVSDNAYLLDYGYPAADRLDSRAEITRTRRNEHIAARLIGFHSIRDGEDNATLPAVVADLTWYRRFALGTLGGEGGLRFQTHGHYRPSTSLLDADSDGISDGRDMRRISLRADWRRDWFLTNGMVAAVLGEASADVYTISQDPTYAGTSTRLHGAMAAELRWPWLKAHANGVSQVIEPVMQLVWAPSGTETLPNEDSALVEFDEGNLFALNRFPGSDAVERGMRANLGVSYLRSDPEGWSLGLTFGRVLRSSDMAQFSAASGLDGLQSDWMAAWQLDLAGSLGITNRLVFDDSFTLTKTELRAALARDRYSLAAGFVYAVADMAENRPEPTSELTLFSTYKLSPNWTAELASRYDFQAERAAKAGLGLTYRNECLAVDLSLSRRFTSSTSIKPTTDFGLSVELLGFGGGSGPGPSRQCRR